MLEFLQQLVSGLAVFVIAALPASNNYKINNYGFGAGGESNMSSSNYAANAITGELSGEAGSNNYKIKGGEIEAQQAHVPPAPTLANTGNWYNKLRLTVNPGPNPGDAKFAVAISTDDFVTTRYVQNDATIGNALGAEDYQAYTAWGGGTGIYVIGLASSTTYKVKVKAMTGKFTESGYSPTAAATTSPPSLTYDIDVSATDSDTNPPYMLSLGNILPGGVVDSPQKIWIDFDTNAESGGRVYVASQSSGLASVSAGYTIGSQTGDLGSISEGQGAQVTSVAQSSGGPLASVAPYNGASNNIGITDTLIREIFSSAAPIVAGRGSMLIKAKSASTTPSSSDYSDIMTVIASASF